MILPKIEMNAFALKICLGCIAVLTLLHIIIISSRASKIKNKSDEDVKLLSEA